VENLFHRVFLLVYGQFCKQALWESSLIPTLNQARLIECTIRWYHPAFLELERQKFER